MIINVSYFTSHKLKWWPSPLLSATVPLEVRLFTPPLPWSQISCLVILQTAWPMLTAASVFTMNPFSCIVQPPCLWNPCMCSLLAECHLLWWALVVVECLFIPSKKINVKISVSVPFLILLQHWSALTSISLGHLLRCSQCEANVSCLYSVPQEQAVGYEDSSCHRNILIHTHNQAWTFCRSLRAWAHQDEVI